MSNSKSLSSLGRSMLVIRYALLPLVLATAFFVHSIRVQGNVATTVELAPGQVWSIKSEKPTTAKIVIGRIENWKGQVTVHCSIIDIPVPQNVAENRSPLQIDHVPFEKSAIVSSLDKLLATGVPLSTGFERGYKHWRADESAGVFTISASKVIALMVESVTKKPA